ncbi:MAG: hypothetical protein ACREQ5_01575 [Candidatus Dormibacteria bacterium]
MAYTFAQLEGYAKQAGFPDNLLATMAAIAMAESSGIDQIQKGQPYSTTGWGLWQITPGNSVPGAGIDNALLNPVNNAKAAFTKWQGQGLGAWTTYTSGAFRQFLQGNVAPDVSTTPNAGGGITGAISGAYNDLTSPITAVGDAISQAAAPFKMLLWFTQANHWVRIFAGGFGAVFVFAGLTLLAKEARS